MKKIAFSILLIALMGILYIHSKTFIDLEKNYFSAQYAMGESFAQMEQDLLEFQSLGSLNNIKIDTLNIKYIIDDEHPLLSQGLDAICFKLSLNRSLIILSSYDKKTFYHELGHCLLNQPHHEDVSHIMHESATVELSNESIQKMFLTKERSFVFYYAYYISLFMTLSIIILFVICLIKYKNKS